MLNKSFLFVFFCLVFCGAKAQLTGTSWKANFSIPEPTLCVLKFYKDSVNLIYAGDQPIPVANGVASGKDSTVLESMSYQVVGDTLVLTKLSGMSPCGTEQGRYKIVFKPDLLSLLPLKDDCADRSSAFPDKLDRVKH